MIVTEGHVAHGRRETAMARIGFLGLGNMGRGMAARLLAAGHELRVWNRTAARAEDLVRDGAEAAETPAAAAAGAAAVFAMLADDAASNAVWLGPSGALDAMTAGAHVVECSTLSTAWVSELTAAAATRGLRYIDCPVTGLPDAAAAGKLTLLVGADDDDLAAARPLLDTIGQDLIHFGPAGAGTAYKLTVNLMGAVQIAGAAEGFAMAAAAGLDLAQVADALAKGQAASPQVIRTAGRITADDHAENVVFAGRLRLKDAAYGVRLARALGLAAPLGSAAERLYARMVERGLGELNDSGVVRLLGPEADPG
jgi:3-hydroxyisobutyrate dehydrogenase